MKTVMVIIAVMLGWAASADAALNAVSGLQDGVQLTAVAGNGDPTQVAVDLAHGFPVWYEDVADGTQLQLCLDTGVEVSPGVIVNPCEYEPPALAAPPSFPSNFGAEALYWSAAALGNFADSNGVTNAALLVLSLEATGANAGALFDGNQAVFSRVRIRVDLPVAGTYRVTHPYGSFDYVVTIPGVRAIDRTQDLGIADPQNFLVAMNDAPIPVGDDGVSTVNASGASIGPFLVPANPHGGVFDPADPATFAGGPITLGGVSYIALPFAPPDPLLPGVPVDVFQPVAGSTFVPAGEIEPANYFRIELLDPPVGFELNPANLANPQRVQFDDFLLVGKLFDASANAIPAAVAEIAGAGMNQSTLIDVAANDTDPVAAGNAQSIDPQALALVDPFRLAEPWYRTFVSGMPQLTATQPTTAGGSVHRVTSIPTGKTSFLYTPPVDYTGADSFEYVIQDAGGLVSAPVAVDIIVEELAIERPDYRPRTGQWQIRGTSSDALDNSVTLYAGPRAALTPDQEVQVPAVVSDAHGVAFLRVDENSITYTVKVDPLPTTSVTAVHIHVGAAGTNGPVLFPLFLSSFGGLFPGELSGTLTSINLQPRPEAGVATFADAITAILSGNAYVNVHTTQYPNGEVRGQLERASLGTAPVAADGRWEFRGRAPVSPGALPSVSAESVNGVMRLGEPLRIR